MFFDSVTGVCDNRKLVLRERSYINETAPTEMSYISEMSCSPPLWFGLTAWLFLVLNRIVWNVSKINFQNITEFSYHFI